MLLGYPASTVRDLFIPATAHVFTNESNFYVRDEWRVNTKLTLNLGLHYEINTPFTEGNNYWVNFDPVRGALLLAGQASRVPESAPPAWVSEWLAKRQATAEKKTGKVEAVEISSRDNDGQQLSLGLQVSGLLLNPQE